MTEFRSGQPAPEAHRALKSSLQTMAKAKRCAVLWFGDILERKLYRELGYSSINQYARQELGFSSSRTGDFLNICRKLKELPKVREEVASGRLGYTAARVLVTVADQGNEGAWLKVAQQVPRRELELAVKRAKKEAVDSRSGQTSLIPRKASRPAAVVPVRLSLELSPTQFARYESLWAQIRKTGGVSADKGEALLEIMASFLGRSSPRGDPPRAAKAPVQIHIHQCPDCAKASVQTGKGELAMGNAERDRALCDAMISREHGRNRSAIPPATRRGVLARDRHRCQNSGCGHTQFLEVHHRIPRSRGGSNDPGNLLTLCSACHQLLHEQVLQGIDAGPLAKVGSGP